MDDSNIEIVSKPILNYASRRPLTRFENWLIRPLNWIVVGITSFCLSFLFLAMGFDIGSLKLFPFALPIFFFVPVGFGLFFFMFIRSLLRAPLISRFELKLESDRKRYLVLFGLPALCAMLSGLGVTSFLLFKISQSEFERVRQTIGPTIPPGQAVDYVPGEIGVFSVDRICRSADGKSIGFLFQGEGGFVWSETGELSRSLVYPFYPQDYTGRFGKHWFWVVPD